ncbi:adenine nucleotide alpha hydrolase family protein [Nakamurella alba]|uniref:hypothetical protein n=1 Tax=Nakamurella alba TaxID=2665158 RepID=UPI0018AACA57|nr:hypothetical protein [Nakamurella alba]
MIETEKSIVVGVRLQGAAAGSSLMALRHAVRRAIPTGTTVVAVLCRPPARHADAIGRTPTQLHRIVAARLDDEIRRLRADLGLAPGSAPEVRAVCSVGHPTGILLESSFSAREIVLGAAGSIRTGDLEYGQVIGTCLRRARCRVTVVDADGMVVGTRPAEPLAG